MTIQDANKLLALAKVNYSYAFKDMTNQEKVMLVNSWAFALQDIQADIVLLAFMRLLTVCKWLPTIAEIREQIQRLHSESSWEYSNREYTPKARAAREYINHNTNHLRGDDKPMLSLDTILNNGYVDMLGSGRMELDFSPAAPEPRYTDYLPERDFDEYGGDGHE